MPVLKKSLNNDISGFPKSPVSENNQNNTQKQQIDTNSSKQLQYTDTDAFNLAINLIKQFEGLELKAYKCPAGKWTIGYGHTAGVKEGMTISQATAEQFLKDDTRNYYSCVTRRAGDVCNSNQIAALTSFCYNVGIDAFCKSTLLKVIKVNPNDFEKIKPHWLEWNKITAKGVKETSQGLARRRDEEFKVYCS
jgi:lysozyme